MFNRTSRLAKLVPVSALILTGTALLTAQNTAKPPAQAAERGPTFRTGARLVTVDVVVSNDAGPIHGLTKDDFTIEDKGKKQEIAVFSSTELNKAQAPQPLGPGIVSNRMNAQGEQAQGATVILYDRANTTAVDQAFVRAQVLKILTSLKPTDKVGFYGIGSSLTIVSDFNNEARPLVEAAKRLQANGSIEGLSPADMVIAKNLTEALSPQQELDKIARVVITNAAFNSIARHLAGVPGRKNVVWVVSRFPLTYGDAPERSNQDEAEVQAFTNRLTENNITVFPVDPGGTGSSFATNTATTADTPTGGGRSRGGATTLSSKDTSAPGTVVSSLTGNQSFQKFASATGGKSFRNSNDISQALTEVIESGSFSYTLGFYPDDKSLDDKVHKLEVKVVKKPGLDKAKLAFRKEYVAWGPQSGPEIRPHQSIQDVMGDPADASAIGLVGIASPDPMKPGYHQLDVRVSVSDMGFKQVAEQWTGAFDMMVHLDGQKNGSVEPFNLVWSQKDYLSALQQGLIVGKSIQTSGSSGVLQIILQDKATGAIGSIRVPFSSAKP